MKINLYALVYLLLCASHMYASDHIITQIIHVEQKNTHSLASNLLYYVTENHELYFSNDELTKKKCIFYEQSTKNNTLTAVEDRVILIGQPINTPGKTGKWMMPAIIKKKGILGKLFGPEICLIKHTKINKELFGFVIERLAKGHRTKVTKIGFFQKKDHLLLVSGSEWPTLKSRDIPSMKTVAEDNNTYLIDIMPDKYVITSNIEKSWLARNTFAFKDIRILLPNQENPSISAVKQKKLPYLPTVFFDPTKDFTHDFITNTFNNYLLAAQNKKDWSNATCFISTNYAVIFFPDNKKCHYYKKVNNAIEFYNNDLDVFENKKISQNNEITACAYDFKVKKLFYATYNAKAKKDKVILYAQNLYLPKQPEQDFAEQ